MYGVVEFDAGVVLFQRQGVEVKILVVDAIKTDARRTLNDQVIGNDLVGEGVEPIKQGPTATMTTIKARFARTILRLW